MTGPEQIDYSSLPEPTALTQSLIVEYQWGAEFFRLLCTAATVRKEKWETGEVVEWLHCKATQFFDRLPTDAELSSTKTLMIPAGYVTRISPGPTFRIAKGRRTEDVGVFPPEKPTPPNALGVVQVDAAISSYLVPSRN
jgi:hypothetical protein